jgi:hypothetical protein
MACAAAAAAPEHQARMLLLGPGDTLSACQTFYWKADPTATRYRISAGSCPGCSDLSEQEAGSELTATLRLPADGRALYVSLAAEVDGTWQRIETAYSAGVGGAPASCEAAERTTVGLYHWAGVAARSVEQGVAAGADLGARAMRVAVSPNYLRDYNRSADCVEAFSLSKALKDPDVRQALSHPRIATYMITAYDGASFDDCRSFPFIRLSFHTPENRERIAAEYAQFTYALYRAHAGSGRRFILSNWESDNAVYCGSAYSYAIDPNARAACDAAYPQVYGNASPKESLEALRLWFTARWEGIQAGRRQAAADGLSGVSVYSAPEINIVNLLPEYGLQSVLRDVLPHVPFDYVSYSSWESMGHGGAAPLKQDLDRIREIAGAATIIVGEIGWLRREEKAVESLNDALDAAQDWGAPFVFHWVMYDDATEAAFGLFDRSGAMTDLGRYYRRRFFAPRVRTPPVRTPDKVAFQPASASARQERLPELRR